MQDFLDDDWLYRPYFLRLCPGMETLDLALQLQYFKRHHQSNCTNSLYIVKQRFELQKNKGGKKTYMDIFGLV